ncbi:MAG: ABC transporter permease subunit [Eubacteriales bacterium]|nr:ABC transporter permease subunit [Eubacteriales bacterium]
MDAMRHEADTGTQSAQALAQTKLRRRKRGGVQGSHNRQLTILALPTLLWFLIFSYLPMPGLLMAFKHYKVVPGQNFFQNLFRSRWSGFDNFKFLFTTPDAKLIITNTIVYNIIFIILGATLPVLFALMISEVHSKGLQKVTQTAVFLPHFLSWVVVSFFVFAFLSDDKGFINQVIASKGGAKIPFYNSPKYWRGLLIFVSQWKGIGYGSVVYLAAITGIDQSFYEAAVIDGASKWQQIKYITIPALKTIIIIQFIMAIGRIFSSDFGLFWNIPRQSPTLVNVWQTIDTYVYQIVRGGSPSQIRMGAAAGFFQSFFGFVTIMIANRIVTKVDEDSALF